MIMLLKLKLGL